MLRSPNNLGLAVGLLNSLPPSPNIERLKWDMTKRCEKCHRFISPRISHRSSPHGSKCNLSHYPNPCDYQDKEGRNCDHYGFVVMSTDDGAPGGDIMGPGTNLDLSVQQQLENMISERDGERRRAELLEAANNQLRSTQDRLQYQLISTTTSLTTTTSTSTSSVSYGMSGLGTGYSVSMIPRMSPSVVATGLQSAVSSHAQYNAVPNQMSINHIPGYSGTGVPGLRTDPNVNPMAQQIMSELVRLIPALAPAPAAPAVVVQPAVSTANSMFLGMSGPPQPQLLPQLQPQLPPTLPPAPQFGAQQQIEELERQLHNLKSRHLPQEQVAPVNMETYLPTNFLQPQASSQPVSLESLYNATIKSRQYKPSDFAKLSSFSYTNQIKSSNLNLALFSLGSFKHLLALLDSTLPAVSQSEFINRIQHILNVLEISCLGSSISDFDNHSWRIAREYDGRITRDIEMGYKTWESLNKSIDPTAWQFARETVPPKIKKDNTEKPSKSQRLCTTYNAFKMGVGCHYEHNNAGESCIYQHVCSKCKSKGLVKKHKAWQCEEDTPSSRVSTSVSTSTPTVTSG